MGWLVALVLLFILLPIGAFFFLLLTWPVKIEGPKAERSRGWPADGSEA